MLVFSSTRMELLLSRIHTGSVKFFFIRTSSDSIALCFVVETRYHRCAFLLLPGRGQKEIRKRLNQLEYNCLDLHVAVKRVDKILD